MASDYKYGMMPPLPAEREAMNLKECRAYVKRRTTDCPVAREAFRMWVAEHGKPKRRADFDGLLRMLALQHVDEMAATMARMLRVAVGEPERLAPMPVVNDEGRAERRQGYAFFPVFGERRRLYRTEQWWSDSMRNGRGDFEERHRTAHNWRVAASQGSCDIYKTEAKAGQVGAVKALADVGRKLAAGVRDAVAAGAVFDATDPMFSPVDAGVNLHQALVASLDVEG